MIYNDEREGPYTRRAQARLRIWRSCPRDSSYDSFSFVQLQGKRSTKKAMLKEFPYLKAFSTMLPFKKAFKRKEMRRSHMTIVFVLAAMLFFCVFLPKIKKAQEMQQRPYSPNSPESDSSSLSNGNRRNYQSI